MTHPTQVLTPETARPVLKRADGSIVLDHLPGSAFDVMIGRHSGPGCKVRWGPRCRVMKRRPKGRENVSMECSCGTEYIEYIPR